MTELNGKNGNKMTSIASINPSYTNVLGAIARTPIIYNKNDIKIPRANFHLVVVVLEHIFTDAKCSLNVP
jgi:hypothetical protein